LRRPQIRFLPVTPIRTPGIQHRPIEYSIMQELDKMSCTKLTLADSLFQCHITKQLIQSD